MIDLLNPPKTNLKRYITEGADLIVFSGGKLLHGPQATGLLFGRKDLVEAALANANPHHAIGRPHKVSREDMAGLYVALKLFLASDEAQMLKNYRQRLMPVIAALKDIPGIQVNIEHDGINYQVPVVVIKFAANWLGPRGVELTKIMLNGKPRIFMQYFRELDHLVVNPISLQPGEADIVAERLREELWFHAKKLILNNEKNYERACG